MLFNRTLQTKVNSELLVNHSMISAKQLPDTCSHGGRQKLQCKAPRHDDGHPINMTAPTMRINGKPGKKSKPNKAEQEHVRTHRRSAIISFATTTSTDKNHHACCHGPCIKVGCNYTTTAAYKRTVTTHPNYQQDRRKI